MSGADFFDTNVLVYAISADARKADRAERLLAGGGVVSVQVLNEFASVTSRKFGLAVPEVRSVLAGFRGLCSVVPVDVTVHDLGLALAERHRLAIYDAMIVAAALRTGCRILWSEDFCDGLAIADLTVRNPFRDEP